MFLIFDFEIVNHKSFEGNRTQPNAIVRHLDNENLKIKSGIIRF